MYLVKRVILGFYEIQFDEVKVKVKGEDGKEKNTIKLEKKYYCKLLLFISPKKLFHLKLAWKIQFNHHQEWKIKFNI